MKPDRSNYEIWLIDWLDGNLDEIRTEQLMEFLEQNTDLKEEAELLSSARLIPENHIPLMKSGLIKTPADLPLRQVEYLSVAYLENDLSSVQADELRESISSDQEKRKIFDSVQKTKLKPKHSVFTDKNKLLRKTQAQKVYILAVRSLSAAAAVIFLLMTLFTLLRQPLPETEAVAVSTADTLSVYAGIPVKSAEMIAVYTISPSGIPSAVTLQPEPAILNETKIAYTEPDTSAVPELNPDMFITAVPVFGDIYATSGKTLNSLAESRIVTIDPRYYDPERGRIKRFIASTFREKILKDKEYNDAPLQPYELAEAGIEGLNKLLGWEMALVKTSNDEGELQSFYFSSRVLKFNAPVKKNDASM